jgi:hypothetical protein
LRNLPRRRSKAKAKRTKGKNLYAREPEHHDAELGDHDEARNENTPEGDMFDELWMTDPGLDPDSRYDGPEDPGEDMQLSVTKRRDISNESLKDLRETRVA